MMMDYTGKCYSAR